MLSSANYNASFSLYPCFNENTCNEEAAKLNSEYSAQYKSGSTQVLRQVIPVNYWPELRRSMYLLFMLGAIAAWLPFFAFDLYKGQKPH
jgi:hypothetical protein